MTGRGVVPGRGGMTIRGGSACPGACRNNRKEGIVCSE